MKRLLLLCTLILGLCFGLLGCATNQPAVNSEAGHDPVWEPTAPEPELISSLRLDMDETTASNVVVKFQFLDAEKQPVTFSDVECTVVVEIDELVQGEEENKDSWFPKKKVLSSRQAKPMTITNSADWVSIPMQYLDLEGVNKDNLQIRVHVKAHTESIYVFAEAPLKLPE
jgi:hypothetical protein